MSDPSSSYANIPPASTEDEVDSLPSSSAGSDTSMSPSEEDELSDAEREWRESLQQLELLLTMVLVPYLGKYFGRKCAYWGTIYGSSLYGSTPLTFFRLGTLHGMALSSFGGNH
jgi:hypothetical protein